MITAVRLAQRCAPRQRYQCSALASSEPPAGRTTRASQRPPAGVRTIIPRSFWSFKRTVHLVGRDNTDKERAWPHRPYSEQIGPESACSHRQDRGPEIVNKGFYEMIGCSEGTASVEVRTAELWGNSADGVVDPLVRLTAAWHSRSAATASQAMLLSATEGTTGTCWRNIWKQNRRQNGNTENMRPVSIHACLA
jgi:hypothetical protein